MAAAGAAALVAGLLIQDSVALLGYALLIAGATGLIQAVFYAAGILRIPFKDENPDGRHRP